MPESAPDGSTRTDRHGETMDQNSEMHSERPAIHCCDCWKYTDDVNVRRDLLARAAEIVINSGTLDVKNSDAFAAADKYLTAAFSMAARLPNF